MFRALMVTTLMVAGCPIPVEGPSSELEISPLTPVTRDPLQATVSGESGESLRYRWTRDGIVVPDLDGPVVPWESTRKGERWAVEVVGDAEGHRRSSNRAEVVIANSAPSVRLSVLSTDPARIEVEARSSDFDEDPVTLSWSWTRNGQPLTGAAGTLTPGEVALGDTIEVRVVPNDGETAGEPASLTFVVGESDPLGSSGEDTEWVGSDDWEYGSGEPSETDRVVCDQDLVIRTQADVDEVLHCEVLRSVCYAHDATLEHVVLPNLIHITGVMKFDRNDGVASPFPTAVSPPGCERAEHDDGTSPAPLVSVSMPLLEHTGPVSFQSMARLETLDLPALRVVRSLIVTNTEVLEEVVLPKLEGFVADRGFIFCKDCAGVLRVRFPSLVGGLTSSLQVQGADLVEVDLGNVREASAVVVSAPALHTLSMPELTHVAGTLAISDSEVLTDLRFGKLESAGELSLVNLTAVTSLDAPKVEHLGALYVSLPSLEEMSFPSLRTVGSDVGGSLITTVMVNLVRIDMPELQSAGRITLGVHGLPAMAFPKLDKVWTDFLFDGRFHGGTKVTDIDLPSLTFVGAKLTLRNHAVLERVDLSSLLFVGDSIDLEGNGLLCTVLWHPDLETPKIFYVDPC
jgi:hypothetical protein